MCKNVAYQCQVMAVYESLPYKFEWLHCFSQIIGYVNDMSTFLHQAYDEAISTKQELQSVQFKVQIVSSPPSPSPPV